MSRGYYSVIQYCPDRFRAEAVNVGLVLLCVDPHVVRVRMASKYARACKLFALDKPRLTILKASVQGLANRITNSVQELRTSEDLATFAASRANDLRLTEPRLAKLEHVDQDFERLFTQLVEHWSKTAPAESSPAELLPPKLGDVFCRLERANKVWHPGKIAVPVYNRQLDIPYAYRNGSVNLVKPHLFPANKRAEGQAAQLAVDGDLIRRHPSGRQKQQLIVVSTQETPEQAREIDQRVAPLFGEYSVRLVRPADIDAFAKEVERSAH